MNGEYNEMKPCKSLLSMVNEIKNAIWTYYDRKEDFKNIVNNCINTRFLWDDSAQKYKFLYLDALSRKNF